MRVVDIVNQRYLLPERPKESIFTFFIAALQCPEYVICNLKAGKRKGSTCNFNIYCPETTLPVHPIPITIPIPIWISTLDEIKKHHSMFEDKKINQARIFVLMNHFCVDFAGNMHTSIEMLINFSVENFRSISERESLILEASTDSYLSHSNVIEAPANHHLLKSVALYGANASGKSNILGAMLWMRRFVLESLSEKVEQAEVPVETNRLREDQRDGASVFEIEFLIQEERFRYGFAVSKNGVEEEWLFRKRTKGPEAHIFKRERQTITPNPRQEKGLEPFVSRTRPNALFLKVCAEFNSNFAEQIMDWFRHFRFVSGLSEDSFFAETAERIQDKVKQEELLQFIQKADFNIQDVESKVEPLIDEERLPDDLPFGLRKRMLAQALTRIKTSHKIYNQEGTPVGIEKFDLEDDESQGTRKFVAMAGPVLQAIEEGSILVIDEFEARLHPRLTKAILEWSHSSQNNKGAQLIIATHDTGLMTPDILRRDQIWFCEKDDKGSTSLYCLDEFNKQDVRATTKFNRQYLEGIFGAVPHVAFEEFSHGAVL